jgi:hypothetical protein
MERERHREVLSIREIERDGEGGGGEKRREAESEF